MPQIPIYEVYNAWEITNDYCEELDHLTESSLLFIAKSNIQTFNWCQRDVDFGRKIEEFPADNEEYDKETLSDILNRIKNICSYCKGYHNEDCHISNARKAIEIALFGECYPLEMNTFGNFLVRKKVITIDNIQEAYILQKRTNLQIGLYCIATDKMTPLEVVKVLKIQKSIPEQFGEIAVKNGFLTKNDVDQTLKFQKKKYLYIGDVLVALGYITQEQKDHYLKRFRDEKGHK